MIKLLHGDCLELMKQISDHSVDLILCDLPYGTTACKWDVVIPFEPLWEQYWRVIKPNGAVVLFGSQPFTSLLITSGLKNYRYNWIWNKTRPSNFPLAKKQPMKYHEDICVFGITSPTYYPQMVKSNKIRTKGANKGYEGFTESGLNKEIYNKKQYTDYYPSSIQIFANSNNKSLHPTQKPVALLEYLIQTYTNENETVLDNCMGSGSTGVACINTNRNFIGIEKDDKYFEIAVNRLKETLDNKKEVLV